MKSLVAYFSRKGENYAVGIIDKGNTQIIAEYISEITGADLFEIKPVREYSNVYKTCCDEAKVEFNNNTRPELQEYLDDIEEYDNIYIGYPIWWGTMPMEVYTFLSKYDFNGKTIIPFSTHEGSGLGHSVSDIKKLLPNVKIEDGIAIQGKVARTEEGKRQTISWINGLKHSN